MKYHNFVVKALISNALSEGKKNIGELRRSTTGEEYILGKRSELEGGTMKRTSRKIREKNNLGSVECGKSEESSIYKERIIENKSISEEYEIIEEEDTKNNSISNKGNKRGKGGNTTNTTNTTNIINTTITTNTTNTTNRTNRISINMN